MNYYIKQFFEVSKDEGVPTAIRLATDFVANTLSRKLITSSPPENPIPLKDKKILFLEAVGKTDGW